MLHLLLTGHVLSGLRVHPDREHLIYPLGSTVVVRRIKDGKQEFLQGHTNSVSCISASKSGSYVASGQVTFMGFKVNCHYYTFSYVVYLTNYIRTLFTVVVTRDDDYNHFQDFTSICIHRDNLTSLHNRLYRWRTINIVLIDFEEKNTKSNQVISTEKLCCVLLVV